MMTQKEFDEAFGDIMLPGLDSSGTYIPLRMSKTLGINVSIRPMVTRMADDVVLYGGKLRVGYTIDGKNFNPVETPTVNINKATAAKRLREFCKGFSWIKKDERRCSTFVGFAVAAGKHDGEKVLKKLEDGTTAKSFIDKLELTYKQYNDVGFTLNKGKAIQALNAAWHIQSQYAFKKLPKPLPDKVVGMESGVMNKAQPNYKGNVVSFQQKVAEKATKELDSD